MRNKLQEFWKGLFLTCDEVTQLCFDTPKENKLTFAKYLKFKIHLGTCIWCRRYSKQSEFLNVALKKHKKKSADSVLLKQKQSQRDN